MSRNKTAERRHLADRMRRPDLFAERWDKAKSFIVGFQTGRGASSAEIADILADGTRSFSVRAVWRRWHLEALVGHRGTDNCSVVLVDGETRRQVTKLAAAQGITPDEWVRRVCICAIEDDLYRAITG